MTMQCNREKIALLTDSCADLSPQATQGKAIFTVPLQVRCGETVFRDGHDLFAADVYEMQKQGMRLFTSLPSGKDVQRVLCEIVQQGYQKVIAVHLSSGLSGTYQTVRLHAQQQSKLDICVFDSLNGSLAVGSIVLQLWEEICAGASWEILVKSRVPHLLRNTFAFFSLDTLEHLRRGGRIGRVTALAGGMLQIKPVLSFADDGQLVNVAKVRGRAAVCPKLLELVHKSKPAGKRYNLAVAHGGAPHELAQLADLIKQELPEYQHFWSGEIDAVLSTYIGQGVLGACIQLLD